MNKFIVGDEVMRKDSRPLKGTIIDRENYYKKKRKQPGCEDYRVADTSHCIVFEDSTMVQVIPDKDLEYHPDFIQKLRERKLDNLFNSK